MIKNKIIIIVFVIIILIILISYFFNDEIINIKEKKLIEKINQEKEKINYCDDDKNCKLECYLLGPVYLYNYDADLSKIKKLYARYNNLNKKRKEPFRNSANFVHCNKIFL